MPKSKLPSGKDAIIDLLHERATLRYQHLPPAEWLDERCYLAIEYGWRPPADVSKVDS